MKPKHSVNSTEIPPLLSGITTTDKYLAVLAAHEDWHRCIVDDYTFIDKPNKVSRKTTHGYIQRQLITDSKAEGEKFLEETEKIFADIVERFPSWQTPDPIIRYRPKQGMYYRQLRFTYDENEKFMQVIPEYLAIINADPSKLDFVFDKYAAARAKCCKFEYTTPSASAIKSKKTSTFEYDYETAISKFIASLTSPEAKKTANHILKRHFEQFYKELFPQWITEDITDTIDYYWVEANVSGGRTRETYDYIRDRYGECITNLIELAGIYYQRLCSECGIQPSDTFLRMFYPILYHEIELLKLKFGVLSGTSTESEKIIQNFQEKIWRNGFNDVTLEQLDNIINEIQNGTIERTFYRRIHRRPETTHYQSNAEKVVIGASIIVGGGKKYRSISQEQYDIERSGEFRDLLIQWARLKGYWFEDIYEYLKQHGFNYLDPKTKGGNESEVLGNGNIVIKIVNPDVLYPGNIVNAINRFVIHNYLFGDNLPLDILGFTMVDGYFRIVAVQQFVRAKQTATEDEIKEFVGRIIPKIKTEDEYCNFHTDDFIIHDLHRLNVLKDDYGNFYVIDNFLKFNNNELHGLGKLSDATHKYSGIYYIPDVEHEGDIDWGKNKITNVGGIIDDIYSERKDEPIDDYYEGRNWYILWHCNTEKDYMNVLRVTDFYSYNSIMRNQLFSNEILLIKQKYKPTKNR